MASKRTNQSREPCCWNSPLSLARTRLQLRGEVHDVAWIPGGRLHLGIGFIALSARAEQLLDLLFALRADGMRPDERGPVSGSSTGARPASRSGNPARNCGEELRQAPNRGRSSNEPQPHRVADLHAELVGELKTRHRLIEPTRVRPTPSEQLPTIDRAPKPGIGPNARHPAPIGAGRSASPSSLNHRRRHTKEASPSNRDRASTPLGVAGSEYSSPRVQEPKSDASRQESSERGAHVAGSETTATLPPPGAVDTAERSGPRTSSPRSLGSARDCAGRMGDWSRPASTPTTSSRQPRTCSVCHTRPHWPSVRSRSGSYSRSRLR